METQFYSLTEIAEKLRIPISTAKRLAKNEAFPGTLRIGKSTFRFSKVKIDSWLNEVNQ